MNTSRWVRWLRLALVFVLGIAAVFLGQYLFGPRLPRVATLEDDAVRNYDSDRWVQVRLRARHGHTWKLCDAGNATVFGPLREQPVGWLYGDPAEDVFLVRTKDYARILFGLSTGGDGLKQVHSIRLYPGRIAP